MNIEPLSVSIVRAGGGKLTVALRYSYEGKQPSPRKRLGMAKAMLRQTLERLEGGGVADVGFSEDALRRVRTDRMEV